jgi:receptor-binding and translocation channel-forming TcA subunit of Tc toxin
MERAYNFENDTSLKVIKNDYGFKVGNPASGLDTKLLGGDRLLLDVESFTYAAITSKTRKNSRIKDVVSIAAMYPAHFEDFRSTGLLSIETDLYEFDRLHPGFYGQRIEAVEINIVGLLPEGGSGLNGSLSAGGVTAFRKKDGTLGKRVHQIDTMALSDFLLRNDVFLYSAETGVRGLFQGLGLGSTWQLHLPKRSNDFDFRRIFDVQFVFYYTAQFDGLLRTNVLAKPPRPGEMSLLRNFGLRYDFPDAWYAFYQGGAAQVTLDRARLPMNQQNFKVKTAFFRVIPKAGVSADGITVKVTAPGGASGTATTDAAGVVSTLGPELGALPGGTPVGQWKLEVLGGASVTDAGVLKPERVYNIQFGLEYSYDAVPEAL